MLKSLISLNSKKGFTLLEVLLSVAIISILAGFSIPIYQSFQNRNELIIASSNIAQAMRRSQILSRAFSQDTNWGVNITSGQITIFSGDSFTGRDTSLDEILTIASSISVSGLTETVFSKFSGLPQTTGTITLTSVNNEERTITINEKGMVDY